MITSLGQYLRERRSERGLSLDSIAAQTRIPLDQLLQLEQEDALSLTRPAVLSKAYIRAYVRCVGFSAEDEALVLGHVGEALDALQKAQEDAAALEAAQRGWRGVYYGLVVAIALRSLRMRAVKHEQIRRWGGVFRGGHERFVVVTKSLLLRIVESLAHLLGRGRQAASMAWIAAQRGAVWFDWTVKGMSYTVAHEMAALHRATTTATSARISAVRGSITNVLRRGFATAAELVVIRVAFIELVAALFRATAVVPRRAMDPLRTVSAFCQATGTDWRATCSAGIVGCAPTLRRVLGFPGQVAATAGGSIARSWTSIWAGLGDWSRASMELLRERVVRLMALATVKGGLLQSAAVWHAGQLVDALQHASYLPKATTKVAKSEGPWGQHRHMFRPESQQYVALELRSATPVYVPTPSLTAKSSAPVPRVTRRSMEQIQRSQRSSMKSWNWIAPYIVAMLLATGLAVVLGNAPLFKSTSLGDTGLTAARVVQFIGLGAGLWLFWALGLGVAAHIPEVPILLSTIRRLMTPLVTLVVLSSAYNVILLVADPFMDRSSRQFYDWTFIIAIILAAAWITLAGFWISDTQVTGEEVVLEDETQQSGLESCRCPQCASVIATGMRFCGSCGCPVG